MKRRTPHEAYRSARYRPPKKHASTRYWYWRARDLALLAAVGVMGLSTVTSWVSGKRAEGGVQSLMSGAGSGVFYGYCSDARAAGAAPMNIGDPGYRPELDRDDDGVACEPYSG